MANYLTQKIEKLETPKQMLARALKQLQNSKPVIKENPKKMLFYTEDKRMFEVLTCGGGPNHRKLIIELWSEEKKKWTTTNVLFVCPNNYNNEQIIELAKSNIDSSKYR